MIKYNMSLNLVTIQLSLPRSKHLHHTNEYFITDQTRTTPIHLLLTCYNCHTWNISPPPVQHILSRWYKNPGQLYCVWTWPGLTLLHITVIVIVWAYIYSVSSRASNEPSRRFHNHGEGPYWGYDLCAGIPISSLLTVFSGCRGLLRDYKIFAKVRLQL